MPTLALKDVAANPGPFLSRIQAANFLGLQPQSLAKMASEGRGPRYVKYGGRTVRYRMKDLIAFVDTLPEYPATQKKRQKASAYKRSVK